MPNHYTNVLYVFEGGREGEEEIDIVKDLVERKWGDNPLNRVVPMPPELDGTTSPGDQPNWYDWQIANRGIKWDAYQVQDPVRLPGDAGAVQLTFCTAWGPPNEVTCAALARELIDTYGAGKVVWVGLDPYDNSFKAVGQWEFVEPPAQLRLVEE